MWLLKALVPLMGMMTLDLASQIEEALDDTDTDTGDGNGGGGSGGGGGGSAGPPTDVYIGDQFKQDAVKRTKMQMFAQLYQQLWGEPATEDYLAKAVNAGMNSWEFAAAERNKPAWADTGAYQKKTEELTTLLANLGLS